MPTSLHHSRLAVVVAVVAAAASFVVPPLDAHAAQAETGIVESIPNPVGGWATLYAQGDAQCQGDLHAATTTDRAGQVIGTGCWQSYTDGYLIFVTDGRDKGATLHLSHDLIEELKVAHDQQASRDRI